MKSITLLALMGFSANAFAAAPHPTAIDADRDGSYAASVDINGDGAKDHLDIGIRAKDLDCDDAHSTVSPRLTEVVGDGINNDCSGSDEVYPVADPVAARYLKNSGAKNPLAFIAEYDRCKAAAAQCELDDVAGTMTIKDSASETHVFRDIYIGTAKVLGSDGIREVVTVEEASHFKGGSAGSSAPSGIGRTTATKIADERAAAAVQPLREELLAADAALDSRVDSLESTSEALVVTVNDHTEWISTLETGIAHNEDAIEAEATARAEADKRIEGKADEAKTEAANAEHLAESAYYMADDAKSHGPLFEAGAVGGAIAHRPIVQSDGDEVRGSAIGGGGFEVRAGVDASGYEVAGFGQFSFGSDGQGTGPDTSLLIGTDILVDVGPEIGPWIGYLRTEDHANLLDASVVENGGLVGISIQGDVSDSETRVVPFLRLGAGIGYYGTKGSINGESVVVSDYGGLGLAQAGVRFGAGALQD